MGVRDTARESVTAEYHCIYQPDDREYWLQSMGHAERDHELVIEDDRGKESVWNDESYVWEMRACSIKSSPRLAHAQTPTFQPPSPSERGSLFVTWYATSVIGELKWSSLYRWMISQTFRLSCRISPRSPSRSSISTERSYSSMM